MKVVSSLALATFVALAGQGWAALLITEVLPGVNTTATSGDTVEIYNSGPGAVDLTDYIITDLDPNSVETLITNETTFAPGSLALPALQAGEFAVVVFIDSTDAPPYSYIQTNYGLQIFAPLATAASSYLDVAFEQVVLATNTGTLLDSVVWGDSAGTPSNEPDTLEDLAALTQPTSYASYTLSTASAWGGPDSIVDLATYNANSIDFNGLTGVSTYGGGVLRRRSTGTIFDEAFPDTAAQWEALPRDKATLGNYSGPVTTVDGLRTYRVTGNIADYIANLRITFFPERRISVAQDQDPSDFKVPDGARQLAFTTLVAECLAGNWEAANSDAALLNYEVVEFLDTVTAHTFYILRETSIPGDVNFTGGGIYVFDPSALQPELVIQAPHPIFDSGTLAQAGMIVQQIRPRVTLIAGAHRKNSIDETLCDGTFFGGEEYRISDVAHYTDNLFHATHKHLMAAIPAGNFIQLHGFCCSIDYGITQDVVLSQGINSVPAAGTLARYWMERINGEAFMADDGNGGDLTEAGLYGDGITVLGATNNIQGRLLNGVTEGDECDTSAVTASTRFIHLEQDPDVREEPQHIIDALSNALSDLYSKIDANDWKRMND